MKNKNGLIICPLVSSIICLIAVSLFFGCVQEDSSSRRKQNKPREYVYSSNSAKDLYVITATGEMKLLYSNIKCCDFDGMRVTFRTEDGHQARLTGPYMVITK